jgi:hypothetical protein
LCFFLPNREEISGKDVIDVVTNHEAVIKMFALSGRSAANFGLNPSVVGMKIHSTDGLSS